jgi:hypothetical protein
MPLKPYVSHATLHGPAIRLRSPTTPSTHTLTIRSYFLHADQAKLGLKRAAELAPEDTAVPKLMARVEAQLKRQADKEKKMYSKMFN